MCELAEVETSEASCMVEREDERKKERMGLEGGGVKIGVGEFERYKGAGNPQKGESSNAC